jgi:predicted anti-sigma-YlaC factor YlaD
MGTTAFSPACERARAQLSARFDGELNQLEDAELRRHLAVCASCSAYEAEVGTFSRMLRTTPLEEPEFPIFVPRTRRLASRIQVGTAAAAVLATVVFASLSGALKGRELHFLSASSSPRPAYLDSSSYEQRLIREATAAHQRVHGAAPSTGSAVAT